MRFLNVMLGVVGVGALAAVSVACGGGSGSNGGAGTTGSNTTTSGGPPKTCAPSAACLAEAKNKDCLGLIDNTSLTKFGLRMAELDVTAPAALASGLVAGVVSGAVQENVAACNLMGQATFNWLLQFDTTAGTFTTGGAKPVADPTMGYSFDNETIMQGGKAFMVAPITAMVKPDPASGAFAMTMGQDLIVPIYLNAQATSVVLLPLHQARIAMGTLSSGNNCIGTYNAANLEVSNSCLPDPMHTPPIPQYNDAGNLDGYITLAEADTVVVSSIMQTLCVILSGNAAMYGMPGMGGLTVCKRDSMNNIVYQGSWCAATNMAATSTCADSEQLKATFAASSVKIN